MDFFLISFDAVTLVLLNRVKDFTAAFGKKNKLLTIISTILPEF